jgi:hypothetical protein
VHEPVRVASGRGHVLWREHVRDRGDPIDTGDKTGEQSLRRKPERTAVGGDELVGKAEIGETVS